MRARAFYVLKLNLLNKELWKLAESEYCPKHLIKRKSKNFIPKTSSIRQQESCLKGK